MIVFKTVADEPGVEVLLSIILTPANLDHLTGGGGLAPQGLESLALRLVIATSDSDAEALAMLRSAAGFQPLVELSSIRSGEVIQGTYGKVPND